MLTLGNELDTRKNPFDFAIWIGLGDLGVAFMERLGRIGVFWSRFGQFRADSSHDVTTLVEDQAVEVVGV